MTRCECMLDTYRSIAAKSGQMLDAAKSSDWDRLIELEHDYRVLITTLENVDQSVAYLDPSSHHAKELLIRKVLADDRAIRQFTKSWMSQLSTNLGNARQGAKARQAYESGYVS